MVKQNNFPEGIEFKHVKRTVRVRTMLEPEAKAISLVSTVQSYTVNTIYCFIGSALGSAPSAYRSEFVSIIIFWISFAIIIMSSILLIVLKKQGNIVDAD